MRLKLLLRPQSRPAAIPINYNYPLAAAIYKLLARAEPHYAAWLHNQGYTSPLNRRMKMFTFSRLFIPLARVDRQRLTTSDDRPWRLYISSPMDDTFVQNVVLGIFEGGSIDIAGKEVKGRFVVESVETLAPPAPEREVHGRMLSPFIAATQRLHNGRQQIYYYRPDDAELADALRRNVLNKYAILHDKECDDPQWDIRFDLDYYRRNPRKSGDLLTIKEGQPDETRLKAFKLPFTIRGNPELTRVAWECGIGIKNSLGLGMVDFENNGTAKKRTDE